MPEIDQLPFDPAQEPHVSLATYRRNGREVRTPVWIAEASGRFYVFSQETAGKVKRIRANGKIGLAACTFRGQIRSEWLVAQARIVTETSDVERAYRALRKKYSWKMLLVDVSSKIFGRYDTRAMIEIRIAQSA